MTSSRGPCPQATRPVTLSGVNSFSKSSHQVASNCETDTNQFGFGWPQVVPDGLHWRQCNQQTSWESSLASTSTTFGVWGSKLFGPFFQVSWLDQGIWLDQELEWTFRFPYYIRAAIDKPVFIYFWYWDNNYAKDKCVFRVSIYLSSIQKSTTTKGSHSYSICIAPSETIEKKMLIPRLGQQQRWWKQGGKLKTSAATKLATKLILGKVTHLALVSVKVIPALMRSQANSWPCPITST